MTYHMISFVHAKYPPPINLVVSTRLAIYIPIFDFQRVYTIEPILL